MQKKQKEWTYQWKNYEQTGEFLFKDWIHPTKLDDFKDKTVLDCGCGSGDHLLLVSQYSKECAGIDLNTKEIATKKFKNKIKFYEGDLAKIKIPEKYDFVYSVGVLQHTENPDKSFENIKKFVKNNGKLIIWVYSKEGNFLNWAILEPLKKRIFLKMPKKTLKITGEIFTALMYIPIYSIYLIPLFKFLPYYEYFQNWRKLSFKRNYLNIFDKLNAPTTNFITKKQVDNWFKKNEFKNIFIDHYKKVSWRASGTKI
jgi:ubiquinone/menaquinone biosynthesis C-methylase UbiE